MGTPQSGQDIKVTLEMISVPYPCGKREVSEYAAEIETFRKGMVKELLREEGTCKFSSISLLK